MILIIFIMQCYIYRLWFQVYRWSLKCAVSFNLFVKHSHFPEASIPLVSTKDWVRSQSLADLRIEASGNQNGCQVAEHCDCFHQLDFYTCTSLQSSVHEISIKINFKITTKLWNAYFNCKIIFILVDRNWFLMRPTHGLMAITKLQLSYLKFCQPSYLNTVCFKQHQKGLLTKHLLLAFDKNRDQTGPFPVILSPTVYMGCLNLVWSKFCWCFHFY